MSAFERERPSYPLSGGLTLHKAAESAFVSAWIAYRASQDAAFGALADLRATLAGVPFLYWVQREQQPLAGLIMLPNNIGDFFLIPPQQHCDPILAALLPLLQAWSNPGKPIRAQMIAAEYQAAFVAQGFTVSESRRRMIRPVSPMVSELPAGFQLIPLNESHRPGLPSLLQAGFTGSPGSYGERTVAQWASSVDQFWTNFEPSSALAQACLLVEEVATKEIVAVLMSDRLEGLAAFRFVATLPAYRGRGLARALLVAGLAALAGHEPWVQLTVTCGNPAEILYDRLGFRALPATFDMVRPVRT
ncbi:MAG: GNAT family N-acetyltransferase [Anaerolineales bacterium]|nr:GNAT family N-acetyltransferase [Anaerolineales bacterium]